MRLWHESILHQLPRQQLLGQHRECCALRGNGWGRNHSTVNYVFSHSPYKLVQYHYLIISEMQARGYNVEIKWMDPLYRGVKCPPYSALMPIELTHPIYPEHDDQYLLDCLNNLKEKNIFITPTVNYSVPK